jgi:hypothetical protein
VDADPVVLLCFDDIISANLLADERSVCRLEAQCDLEEDLVKCKHDNRCGLLFHAQKTDQNYEYFKDPPLGPNKNGCRDGDAEELFKLIEHSFVRPLNSFSYLCLAYCIKIHQDKDEQLG